MKFRKREMVCQILKNNSILTIRKDKKKKKYKNANAEIFTKTFWRLLNVLYHGLAGDRCHKQLNVSRPKENPMSDIFASFFLFFSRRMT